MMDKTTEINNEKINEILTYFIEYMDDKQCNYIEKVMILHYLREGVDMIQAELIKTKRKIPRGVIYK